MAVANTPIFTEMFPVTFVVDSAHNIAILDLGVVIVVALEIQQSDFSVTGD
jgi:hypothetical protein